ncbi:flagellar hook basal-body protein [Altererythrobacter sp. CC-YST694]|uniref:flagellar hook-basal body protein n=1 Tax=Altererythrobacter sp. CC-YST694 TaxID=2755038 RepID=UPI001D021DFF|nr:flagellar hook basal-body protein [Altererythrobacter sp. CC-YST694]MCB5423842.1 flagellar hook basal-body protein [Altererythrobacter sp. CC-YST694]
MNGAFEVGAVALRAQQRALEVHANNIANVNTPAFKRTEAHFAEVLARSADGTEGQGVGAGMGTDAAAALSGSAGVRMVPQTMIFAQGTLKPSGNALDLAIDGRGFVELAGLGGETLFWRGGRLRVNEDGLLATSAGIPLQAGIAVPDDATELSITQDGLVSVRNADDEITEIGQVSLVRPELESALERLDDGLYRPTEGARLIDARPGEDGAGRIVQGSVEQSTVELSAEMVEMLMVQRAFAADAQILQAADQLAAITNTLRR